MNIYADRGNLTVFERRCDLARARLRARRRGASATRSTPTRTTSSTSAAARTATRRSARATSPPSSATRCTPPPTAARSCSRSAAGSSCSATATTWRTSGCPGVGLVDLDTRREDGPRLLGNIAIALDLPGGPARARGLREPRRADLPRRRRPRRSAGCSRGNGNNGADGTEGVRGGAARHGHRDLHARPAAAEEHGLRGLAHARRRWGSRRASCRRSTTGSRPRRTRRRRGPRASGVAPGSNFGH